MRHSSLHLHQNNELRHISKKQELEQALEESRAKKKTVKADSMVPNLSSKSTKSNPYKREIALIFKKINTIQKK